MSVVLFFPPIVNSGFGGYYPALAVLAGYLASHQLEVVQLDLNAALAERLLDPAVLADCGQGLFFGDVGPGQPPAQPQHMAAVAARLLKKVRDQLYDNEGRHRFSEREETPAYLLSVLAQPYVVDRSLDATLADIAAGGLMTSWYRRFYEMCNLAQQIPQDATLIGISVPMGPQLLPALVLAGVLRQIRPHVRLVLGGPTMSLMNEAALALLLQEIPAVDAVVRYEGERPLLALARQCAADEWNPEQTPGTSSCRAGRVTHRPPGPGVALEALPFAAYDPELLSRLHDPELGVVQTRGCYWGRCAYCDFVELYDGSPRYRGRSAASFVDELEHLHRTHGVSRFSLITEAIPPSFALKFSELVVERGLQVRWSSFAMVDPHFKRRHFEAMARSGCEHLVIGLETMNDRVLSLVHKYASGDDNEQFLREASSAGISLRINLIPDLPTTTFAEAEASLKRLASLSETVDGVAVFPFEATRSSQIGRMPERYGVEAGTAGDVSGQALFAENHLQISDTAMTDDERTQTLQRYQAFADAVNARSHRTPSQPARDARSQVLQIASCDFDVSDLGDRIRVFNWKTRDRWEAPAGFKAIIDRAEQIGPVFNREALLGGATQRAALNLLIDQLILKRILTPVANESTAS